MNLKKVTLLVIICTVASLVCVAPLYVRSLVDSPVYSLPSIVAVLLREGSFLTYFIYLYRRS
jgi:hypothetical protein